MSHSLAAAAAEESLSALSEKEINPTPGARRIGGDQPTWPYGLKYKEGSH